MGGRMVTDDSVSILTHAAAVSQSAPDCRKPLRRYSGEPSDLALQPCVTVGRPPTPSWTGGVGSRVKKDPLGNI